MIFIVANVMIWITYEYDYCKIVDFFKLPLPPVYIIRLRFNQNIL